MRLLLEEPIQEALTGIYNKIPDASKDCIIGCNGVCCTENAYATHIESAYMLVWLLKHFPEDKVREILTKKPEPVKERPIGAKGLLLQCKFYIGEPDHGCLVYEARPGTCRCFGMDYSPDECGCLCIPLNREFLLKIQKLNDSSDIKDVYRGIKCKINTWADFWAQELFSVDVSF